MQYVAVGFFGDHGGRFHFIPFVIDSSGTLCTIDHVFASALEAVCTNRSRSHREIASGEWW